MYAEYLKLSACEIEEAEDGREALAKAISHSPDIIVTETRLPGLTGLQLCDVLRSDAATHNIPIVFVTADAFGTDVRRAHTAGADTVLVKPCLPETLLLEIQRLMALSADLRERARQTRDKIQEQLAASERVLAKSRAHHERRLTLSRAHLRGQTVDPPDPAPTLVCPHCDQPLLYARSHVGGVSARHAEQWDYYDCPTGCGTFQYRHRTRKLRRVS
jgi:two-component system cell cycle response regulator DivK